MPAMFGINLRYKCPFYAALIGSALGFLGMGAQPPTAELGMMAAQGRDFLFMAPHIATIPSFAIFVIVLAANLLGDALRDVLDPRLQT